MVHPCEPSVENGRPGSVCILCVDSDNPNPSELNFSSKVQKNSLGTLTTFGQEILGLVGTEKTQNCSLASLLTKIHAGLVHPIFKNRPLGFFWLNGGHFPLYLKQGALNSLLCGKWPLSPSTSREWHFEHKCVLVCFVTVLKQTDDPDNCKHN